MIGLDPEGRGTVEPCTLRNPAAFSGHRVKLKQETRLAPWTLGGGRNIRILPLIKRRLARKYRRLGNAARDSNDGAKALARYRMALKFGPADGAVWVQYGHALKDMGRLAEACAAYDAAIRVDPADGDALFCLGVLLLRLEYFAEAANAFAAGARAKHAECFKFLLDPRLAQFSRTALDAVWPERFSKTLGVVEDFSSTMVTGWLHDPEASGSVCEVEFSCDGKVLGRCLTDRSRPDVSAAGLTSEGHGFLFDLSAVIDDFPPDALVSVQIAGRPGHLIGSPFKAARPVYVREWLSHSRHLAAKSVGAAAGSEKPARVSIIMPVHNPRQEWLREAIQSVLRQTTWEWELICVDDGSSAPHVHDELAAAAAADSRIRYVASGVQAGIAKAVNAGMAHATGEMITFLDHDDVLEPDAIQSLIEASEYGYGLIYTDEVLTHESTDAIRHFTTRPSFSHDYYLSHPYFVHLIAVPANLARSIGGWDETMSISADVDFVLRALENSDVVTHVAKPLYRWRTHPDSAGHQARENVTRVTMAALQRHLGRLSRSETVVPGDVFNTYRLESPLVSAKVLIVIPTKNRLDLLQACVSSIEHTGEGVDFTIVIIDHDSSDRDLLVYLASTRHVVMKYSGDFNFSKMNNEAVRAHGSGHDLVLFLNNDIEAVSNGWLSSMTSVAMRPDVGVVGATLIYPSQNIQHAGVVIGLGGYAEHVHKGESLLEGGGRNPGDGCDLVSTRDYSAVTAACLMMRRSLFEALEGFDEAFAVGFNDTDLCLRVQQRGYKVLKHADAILVHNESATRASSGHLRHPKDADRLRARWPQVFAAGDPWFSPLRSLDPGDRNLTLLGKTRIRVTAGLKGAFK